MHDGRGGNKIPGLLTSWVAGMMSPCAATVPDILSGSLVPPSRIPTHRHSCPSLVIPQVQFHCSYALCTFTPPSMPRDEHETRNSPTYTCNRRQISNDWYELLTALQLQWSHFASLSERRRTITEFRTCCKHAVRHDTCICAV